MWESISHWLLQGCCPKRKRFQNLWTFLAIHAQWVVRNCVSTAMSKLEWTREYPLYFFFIRDRFLILCSLCLCSFHFISFCLFHSLSLFHSLCHFVHFVHFGAQIVNSKPSMDGPVTLYIGLVVVPFIFGKLPVHYDQKYWKPCHIKWPQHYGVGYSQSDQSTSEQISGPF